MTNRPHQNGLRDFLVVVLLAAVTLAVSSWFFLSMGKFTDGALAAPLDDSYIYFQYARNFSEGNLFRYCEGAAPSTGASSITYVLILAAARALGAEGESMILFAFGLGTCLLFASSLLVRELLRPLAGGLVAAGGAVLLLLNGHVVWVYLSGMGAGFFATTILLTLLVFQRERTSGRFYGTSIAAALMGFSRPEGFFLALPVALLVFVLPRERPLSERFLLAAISLSCGLQFVLNFALTGSFASTGAQAKSVFHAQEPDVWRLYMLRFFELPWHVLRLFLTDFYSSSFGPLWARISDAFLTWGFCVAVLGFVFAKRHRNSLPVLLSCWVILSVFLSLIPWAWDVHHYRYQVPFFPVFLVISSAGAGFVLGLLPRRLRVVSVALGLALFAAVAVSFLGSEKRMTLQYAHNCENIFTQQVKVGRWLKANTPPDAIVGLNDAGAVTYVGERRAYDFVGIVTTGQAVNWRSGIGSVIEALERLPEERLPDLLAIYPNWLPFLIHAGIAKDELFRAHLRLNTICGGTDKVVYLPDWTLLGTGENPPQEESLTARLENLSIVDAVDVGDLGSEKEHGYRWLGKWRSKACVLPDAEGKRILDGGREHWAGEVMRVRCAPVSPLFVLIRLDDSSASLALFADDTLVETALYVRKSGHWTYVLFEVPEELVKGRDLRITVVPEPRDGDESYASFHYWFFQ